MGGPEPLCVANDNKRDALAICSGEGKRFLAINSFTSLGVVHKWLLIRVEATEEGDDTNTERDGHLCDEFAADLCVGALGLLGEDGHIGLSRTWESLKDDRFIKRIVCWGDDAELLAVSPKAAGPQGNRLQRMAMEALLQSLPGLSAGVDEILARN